jgi:hypothetical protein
VKKQTSQETSVPVQKTIHIIAMGSDRFCITQEMLEVDEETMQKKLKYIYHLEFSLPKVPTKLLYKIQINVMQEIQSRARANVTSLKFSNEVKRTLELTINQVQFERDTVKNLTGRIEQQVEKVFKTITDNMQEMNIQIEEKIEKILQDMEAYKSHITELTEILAPSTPLEVITQREQEVTSHSESIARSIQEITKLYKRTAQLWTDM